MAREKRQISPTGIYHVLLRGINELFSEKDDYEEFIAVLKRYFENTDAELLGYALMKNRVHIIIGEKSTALSMIMKPICTSYARYYNRVHDLQGKLFYDRYKSEPVYDDEHLREIRIFLNTVPSEYKGRLLEGDINKKLPYIDDYCRMTDEELKHYLESIFKCDIAAMPKDQRKVMAEQIIEGKRISAGRIYSIFGLGRKPPETKKAEVKKENNETKEKEPPKKQELSVWLL